MLYSSGVKGTRTRRIQGGATKHFTQDVTTSLVQRLEPIAWFDSMIWIAMTGDPLEPRRRRPIEWESPSRQRWEKRAGRPLVFLHMK